MKKNDMKVVREEEVLQSIGGGQVLDPGSGAPIVNMGLPDENDPDKKPNNEGGLPEGKVFT